MSEVQKRYKTGELVPASDFRQDLDFFGEVVWQQVIDEKATRQKDLDGEIWYKRVHPIEMEEHLDYFVDGERRIRRIT